MVVGRHTSYKMCAFSQEEMNQWISAIELSGKDSVQSLSVLVTSVVFCMLFAQRSLVQEHDIMMYNLYNPSLCSIHACK
ncbi:unnamed protein product [Wuchereria bancrofti]|uniref:PH domain-containing protein n=1 Tax=Wuchereria bancrofti TaxID=6293 RepID=A0A3P7E7G8_WUCBA|nr:unnamed protein product [Wuchereria bancrofti]